MIIQIDIKCNHAIIKYFTSYIADIIFVNNNDYHIYGNLVVPSPEDPAILGVAPNGCPGQ